MSINQFDYDNAQESEMSREEAIEEKQYQLADKIRKEITGDNNATTIAFINHLSEGLYEEDYELLKTVIDAAICHRFSDRNNPFTKLVNNAVSAQALALAKQEYPITQ